MARDFNIQFDASQIGEWAAYAGGGSHYKAEGAESRFRGILSKDCPYNPATSDEMQKAKDDWYAGYWKADAHCKKTSLGQWES